MSHRDKMNHIGIIVNNYVVSLYGDRWWLALWWSFRNRNIKSPSCAPETVNNRLLVSYTSIKTMLKGVIKRYSILAAKEVLRLEPVLLLLLFSVCPASALWQVLAQPLFSLALWIGSMPSLRTVRPWQPASGWLEIQALFYGFTHLCRPGLWGFGAK